MAKSVAPSKQLTPSQALAKLKEGNRLYVSGQSGGKKIDDAPIRKETSSKQAPFAAIVSCSDSRVPSERLFSLGVGDLFIIRNAGNTVVDNSSLGSIQFAVGPLGVPLVVVMGHERCGAIQAAAKIVTEDEYFPGSIGRMLEPILPSVLGVRSQPGDLVENAIRENVRRMTAYLRADPILAEPLKARKVVIVGARFDLDDGVVEFLEEA